MEFPGITKPYVYVGKWRSCFGWHKEDQDLYSINYLHSGSPKVWYSLDMNNIEKFEQLVKEHFPYEFQQCPEFLRHKTVLFEPSVLLKHGIKLHKIIQMPREFVICKAQAYHSGFNVGFNIAEAINFAMPSWLKIAQQGINFC